MDRNNSSKKNLIKKSLNKDYMTHYEPLFAISNQPEMRSNSVTPDRKTRRQTIPGEIPSVLKRNILALSESTDSIKLTDFGKSFIVDDKTPPKKKKRSLFDELVCDDSKNIEIVPTENKHLKSVREETVRKALTCSPSICDIKPKKMPSSPVQKFPNTNFEHKPDVFDKLKYLDNQPNDSKANSKEKEEAIIKESSKYEKSSKDKNKKEHLDEEKSVTESSSSSSHSAIKIDRKFIKNFRDSLNGFREMLSGVKSINEKILTFRQELSEGLMFEFPTSQH